MDFGKLSGFWMVCPLIEITVLILYFIYYLFQVGGGDFKLII